MSKRAEKPAAWQPVKGETVWLSWSSNPVRCYPQKATFESAFAWSDGGTWWRVKAGPGPQEGEIWQRGIKHVFRTEREAAVAACRERICQCRTDCALARSDLAYAQKILRLERDELAKFEADLARAAKKPAKPIPKKTTPIPRKGKAPS